MNARDYVGQVLRGRASRPVCDESEAFAPANIALAKYWGKRDGVLNLPVTSSLSVSLGELGTTTRVRIAKDDAVRLNGQPVAPDSAFARRLYEFIDLFRPDGLRLHVETVNSIPTAAGLASSASGFAALTLALNDLLGWTAARGELSMLARLGSGSAARSLWPGFVRWIAGTHADGLDCRAEPLAETWPDLRLGLVEVSALEKEIGSRDAMNRTVATSPYFAAWPARVEKDLARLEAAIRDRDFAALGATAEANALAMHATMMAASPPVLFWLPESVAAMRTVWAMREAGLPVFFTMDAGPNVKLIYEAGASARLHEAFPGLREVAPFHGAA